MARIRALPTVRARRMRREATRAEAHLWNALRASHLGGWKWKRQVPFGPYILDFLSVDAALVVEVDGGQEHRRADQSRWRVPYDPRRLRG
jgi:very-short-patch-repair endonuclease